MPVSGQIDNMRIRRGRIGANRRAQDEDWALTMRLRIAHLDLQKALRDAIHLLNLHTQTSRIIAIRARSAPLELQHRCSREEDVEITDSLLAPAEAGLVKDARARKGRDGRGHGRGRGEWWWSSAKVARPVTSNSVSALAGMAVWRPV